MIALTLLVPIALLAFLLWWEKRDRAVERKAWELERIALVQRIQAPARAVEVFQAENEVSAEPVYVNPEDPGAWDDFVEARMAGEAR